MKREEYTCDKCGKVEFNEKNYLPDGWRTLYYRVDYSGDISKHLCPNCCKLLGIKPNRDNPTEERSLGDRLVDILTEIAESSNQ